ncbi:hypothetical protein KXJ72_06600 [Comamonas aquatica]|nr:hypothetical protein KXJ72_06600 [Comamonas aquatica]
MAISPVEVSVNPVFFHTLQGNVTAGLEKLSHILAFQSFSGHFGHVRHSLRASGHAFTGATYNLARLLLQILCALRAHHPGAPRYLPQDFAYVFLSPILQDRHDLSLPSLRGPRQTAPLLAQPQNQLAATHQRPPPP